MILNSHNVLSSSLDYVHMEVYVRFISDSFSFIFDSFFRKFNYDTCNNSCIESQDACQDQLHKTVFETLLSVEI